ncbi:MAG: AAA family ATPase, partial [bacterium]
MYLKKLELIGFKSFAQKTTLEFDRGIVSIVGPNGSGKSNVADAIRWVLGEQSIKLLRGKRSEDVIFSGSSSRGRLGMAEVSIHLDNADRQMPVDYPDVVITRRVYRSG